MSDTTTGGTGYQCGSCGGWVGYNQPHTCSPFQMPPMIPVGSPQGWKCPHCGKAHAPSVMTCPGIGIPMRAQ